MRPKTGHVRPKMPPRQVDIFLCCNFSFYFSQFVLLNHFQEHHRDNLLFILTHFPHRPLWKHFHGKFMWRSVLTPYFVHLDSSENLVIFDKSLSDLLIDIGWTNALVFRESYHPYLAKISYLNMLFLHQLKIKLLQVLREFLLNLMLRI